VIANPIPVEAEIAPEDWSRWFAQAKAQAAASTGRDVTPALLANLHAISQGKTLAANLTLIKDNVKLGAQLAQAIAQ
jgi:pseudouridine-5'-phosphate glycosidase